MLFDYANSSTSNSCLRKSIFLLLTLVFLISFPFTVVSFIFGALYRLAVLTVAKLGKPDLSKCLTVTGHLFSTEDIYSNPKTKIVVQIVFEGIIDEHTIRTRIIENLINAKLPNGQLVYPELQQFLVKWCGYYFWKNDTNFDVNNHLRYILQADLNKDINEAVSDDEIVHIWSKILNEGFPENIPLWEIVVIPNHYPAYNPKRIPHTSVLLFLHHTLGDGYSVLHLIRNQLFHNGVRSVQIPKAKLICLQKTSSNQQLMRKKIKEYCFFPFKFMQVICEIACLPFMRSPFTVKDKHQNEKCHHRVSQKISLNSIKSIKDHFKTSFTSVIFATVGFCLKENLERKGAKVPNTVIIITPYPKVQHSSKLRNEFTGISINLPLWARNEKVAIEDCHKQYESKRNVAPLASDIICRSIYSLPYSIHKVLGKNRGIPVNLSNFSFGQNGFYFDESRKNKCTEVLFDLGVGFGAAGIGIRIATYEDGLRVTVAVNVTVMTSQEADLFIQAFEKKILSLENNIRNETNSIV